MNEYSKTLYIIKAKNLYHYFNLSACIYLRLKDAFSYQEIRNKFLFINIICQTSFIQ